MKIALVYDWINKWGGAERVLLALHELFPEAPLYTAVYNEKKAPWANVFNIKTSFLQKIPIFRSNHEYLLLLLPIAFESFDFSEFDLVISVTSAFAKSIITKPETFHLCYLLTPPRYLWSNSKDYKISWPLSWMWEKTIRSLRSFDQITAKRVDKYLAISQTVAERLDKYYQQRAEVLYPPVSLPEEEIEPKVKPDNFFLIVSRLVPYKRIDLAISVFNKLKLPLVVIGKGREYQNLKNKAKPNITFLKGSGSLTDSELSWYYRHCQALILPQEEDFGLSAVEAQLSGSPVIAYKKGGATESVIDGKTGCFFYPQSEEALMKVITNYRKDSFNRKNCIQNAKKYDKVLFIEKFMKIIKEVKQKI